MTDFRPANTTNKDGVENYLQVSGFDYTHQYGMNDNAVLKPFTTDTSVTGKPAYVESYSNIGQAVIINSGAGATSSGLNPYGPSTIGEGLFWGEDYLEDNDSLIPDHKSVRTFGFKNPMQIVGWGYDIFGNFVPNANTSADGVDANYIEGISPDNFFLGVSGSDVIEGRNVPLHTYKAGPLDLRWDAHRGVWCGWHGGVQIGTITKATSGSTELSDPSNESVFAQDITYDVIISDGAASSISMTGLVHVGPKPDSGTYKVVPYASGDSCFVVNKNNKYEVWLMEKPATEDCEEDSGTYNFSTDGNPWDSSKLLDGTGLFSALASGGLPSEFGGSPIQHTGMTATMFFDSDQDGDVDGYLVFISGILMYGSGDTVHTSFQPGVTDIQVEDYRHNGM